MMEVLKFNLCRCHCTVLLQENIICSLALSASQKEEWLLNGFSRRKISSQEERLLQHKKHTSRIHSTVFFIIMTRAFLSFLLSSLWLTPGAQGFAPSNPVRPPVFFLNRTKAEKS
jgi:hypothetical protein